MRNGMDNEAWAAFRIALAVAVIVGFGLYQFGLKYESESRATHDAILGAQSMFPRGWSDFTFTVAGRESLVSTPSCPLYVMEWSETPHEPTQVSYYSIHDSVFFDSINVRTSARWGPHP